VPRLVPKGSRRVDGLVDRIISLYAGGMTIGDIQLHLLRRLDAEEAYGGSGYVDRVFFVTRVNRVQHSVLLIGL
jgi:hypothetical protein